MNGYAVMDQLWDSGEPNHLNGECVMLHRNNINMLAVHDCANDLHPLCEADYIQT